VFYAFSTFVVAALGRLPAAQGIAAMQSINVVVLNASFLGVFIGTAVACAVMAALALAAASWPVALLRLAGALLYGVGTFGVTIVRNVPLNEALARAAPDSAEGAQLWARYRIDWTFWNHVRSAAGLLAAAVLIVSLR